MSSKEFQKLTIPCFISESLQEVSSAIITDIVIIKRKKITVTIFA
jgi:hypothetical protein